MASGVGSRDVEFVLAQSTVISPNSEAHSVHPRIIDDALNRRTPPRNEGLPDPAQVIGFSLALVAYETMACPTRMRSITFQLHEMPIPIAAGGTA
jgi:hypothetical protein